MLSVIIAFLLVIGVFLALPFALGRETREVESARDTEYVELEGVWVRYKVAGSGPPVVLVHGWLSSSRIWEPLAEKLSQRFTVYTLDLTGFGESDKPLSGYGLRPGSRRLHAFCTEFGITGAAIVGHDIGGNIAVKLAADHPDVVGKLVLVAAPADAEQIDLPTLLWLSTVPVVGPAFYALGRSVRFLRRRWMKPFVSEVGDLPQQAVEDAGRSTPAAAGKSLKAARRELSRERLVRQARRVKAPFLLIAGEEDRIVDPEAVNTWTQVAPASEVFLIKNCGHLPMVEEPAAFEDRVLSYLTGDSGQRQITPRPPETPPATRDGEPPDPPPSSQKKDRPTVHRKRGGSYSTRPDPGIISGGGKDSHRKPSAGSGKKGRSGPVSGNGKTGGYIPELPEDLFEWPEAQGTPPRKSQMDPSGEVPADEDNEEKLG